jgi:hypothetical protein|tara:strand:- start:2300 stop:2479 length:180 start_codon:yes stop_codon:yes gene_type:complete
MNLREMFKDEVLEQLVLEHLKEDLECVIPEDRPLVNALHVVIAYYSVPGTYMEGAFDGQ